MVFRSFENEIFSKFQEFEIATAWATPSHRAPFCNHKESAPKDPSVAAALLGVQKQAVGTRNDGVPSVRKFSECIGAIEAFVLTFANLIFDG